MRERNLPKDEVEVIGSSKVALDGIEHGAGLAGGEDDVHFWSGVRAIVRVFFLNQSSFLSGASDASEGERGGRKEGEGKEERREKGRKVNNVGGWEGKKVQCGRDKEAKANARRMRACLNRGCSQKKKTRDST